METPCIVPERVGPSTPLKDCTPFIRELEEDTQLRVDLIREFGFLYDDHNNKIIRNRKNGQKLSDIRVEETLIREWPLSTLLFVRDACENHPRLQLVFMFNRTGTGEFRFQIYPRVSGKMDPEMNERYKYQSPYLTREQIVEQVGEYFKRVDAR